MLAASVTRKPAAPLRALCTATPKAWARDPSGFENNRHVVDFHFREPLRCGEWKATKDWGVDWRTLAGEASTALQAQQRHIADTGESEYSAALRAAGGAKVEAPPALSAIVDSDIDGLLVETDGKVVVDDAAETALTELLGSIDSALSQLQPMTEPSAADYEEYQAALAAGDDISKLLAALDNDAGVDEIGAYLHPDDEGFVAAAEELSAVDPFEEEIASDENAMYFNEYDSYKDIKDDWQGHLERWDDFSTVKLEEPSYLQFQDPATQEVARLLETNTSYSKEDVAGSVAYFDALVNKKNAAPEDPKGEFPEIDYPPAAPWLFERPVKFPGEDLASRIGDDLDYDNTEDVAQAEADALGLAPGDFDTSKLEPQNYDELKKE